MRRAILITVEDETVPYVIHDDMDGLDQMQAAVGGMFQVVSHNLTEPLSFFCNEEDWTIPEEQQQRNNIASELCSLGFEGDYHIIGPVLVMGGVDNEGETQGLTVEQTELFLGPKADLLAAFKTR
jgi:hypothetical protein